MTPKQFENYLDDRIGQMMARNRVIKYVPRKKSFWERLFRKKEKIGRI